MCTQAVLIVLSSAAAISVMTRLLSTRRRFVSGWYILSSRSTIWMAADSSISAGERACITAAGLLPSRETRWAVQHAVGGTQGGGRAPAEQLLCVCAQHSRARPVQEESARITEWKFTSPPTISWSRCASAQQGQQQQQQQQRE